MRPTSTRRRPGALLLGFALVLLLHPASGASQATGEGIGGLLKALLCACASCQAEEPTETDGCCSEEPAEPVDDCAGGCSCAHELELPDQLPLSLPPHAGDTVGPAFVAAHAQVAALTIDRAREVAQVATGPPRPAPLRSWSGTAPFRLLAAGPNGLLAVLCTARI
jgi:hypothetical protein